MASFLRFDSASTPVRVVAAALAKQRDVGLCLSPAFQVAVHVTAFIPKAVGTPLYSWGAARQAMRPDELTGNLDADAAKGMVEPYKATRRFPALFIGSPVGSIADLAVAAGAAFLPQTFLVLVRTAKRDPDDIQSLIRASAPLATSLSHCFPKTIIHQMHDPQNDRLTVGRVAYFRMKWRRLPNLYRRFITERLEPGGTIFIVDCRYKWPVLRFSEKHTFQIGGLGGIEPGEYLQRYGYSASEWKPEREAEWGYDDALTADITEAASVRKQSVVRIAFDHPQDFSGPVARLFRENISRKNPSRLLVTNFAMLAPVHVLATGAVPYWSVWNDITSLNRLSQFLSSEEPFDMIDSLLFQNGAHAQGQATARQWLEILQKHANRSRLVGLKMEQHPFDFAALERYRRVLRRIETEPRIPHFENHAVASWLRKEGVFVESVR